MSWLKPPKMGRDADLVTMEDKVLRRLEVGKMSRKLKDRLALASYKHKHGLANMSFTLVEAHLDHSIRTRAPSSSVVSSSGSSSSTASSSAFSEYPANRQLRSSPFGGMHFSDGLAYDEDMLRSRKRARFHEQYLGGAAASERKPRRARYVTVSSPPSGSHPGRYGFYNSSPLQSRSKSSFAASFTPAFTFMPSHEDPHSPPLGANSDSEDLPLPVPFHGEPPRTPPPTSSRGLRSLKSNGVPGDGDEGAQLLLHFHGSPTPASRRNKGSHIAITDAPPSTPPSKHSQLPSSLLETPTRGGFAFAGLSTPGQTASYFNDWVNFSPSPAQAAFSIRTPGPTRTPLAAKEARRRLNFDTLVPPNGSPTPTRRELGRGLGMELGDEAVG